MFLTVIFISLGFLFLLIHAEKYQFTSTLVQTLYNTPQTAPNAHPMYPQQDLDDESDNTMTTMSINLSNEPIITFNQGVLSRTSFSVQEHKTLSIHNDQHATQVKHFNSMAFLGDDHYNPFNIQSQPPTLTKLSINPQQKLSFSSQLSIFERLSVYNNFIRSKTAHSLNQSLQQAQQHQNSDDGCDFQPLEHRSLQQFTALALQNNPLKQHQVGQFQHTDGYTPSRVVKRYVYNRHLFSIVYFVSFFISHNHSTIP
jgi:hypothetical protein